MKKYISTSVFVLLLFAGTNLHAQNRQDESLGLPGDNLNLYAVMDLFQRSETLESFERNLNDPDSKINNLDLNGDGQVDYIRVIDNVDGKVHNIVLQVALGPRESQDVAVFTVWRESDDRVLVQLTGDEDLYGRDYIIEPIMDQSETPNPGYTGNVTVVRTNTVEIASWPLVHFIFLPNYIVWHSPWYYSYYPSYWHPWRPYYWDYYYGYHYNRYDYYYGHYRHWNDHRYPSWHDTYYSRRTYSPVVRQRVQSGYYKSTYSHPEQRREGTASYYKSHPEDRRSAVRSTGARSERRTTTSGTTRQTTTSGTSRRTNTSGVTTDPNNTRKSTSTRTERRTVSGGTEGRTVPTTRTERKSTTSTGNVEKSTSSGNNRSVSTPRSERRATQSSGTTRQSGSTTTTRRSSRRAAENKASGTTSKTEGRRGKSR